VIEEVEKAPQMGPETSCPKKKYLSNGYCLQVSCNQGWEVMDSGDKCGKICNDYYYQSTDG